MGQLSGIVSFRGAIGGSRCHGHNQECVSISASAKAGASSLYMEPSGVLTRIHSESKSESYALIYWDILVTDWYSRLVRGIGSTLSSLMEDSVERRNGSRYGVCKIFVCVAKTFGVGVLEARAKC
jgi:hypothetical protein